MATHRLLLFFLRRWQRISFNSNPCFSVGLCDPPLQRSGETKILLRGSGDPNLPHRGRRRWQRIGPDSTLVARSGETEFHCRSRASVSTLIRPLFFSFSFLRRWQRIGSDPTLVARSGEAESSSGSWVNRAPSVGSGEASLPCRGRARWQRIGSDLNLVARSGEADLRL